MYKFTAGIMILVGVGLLLAGISYLLMVLYGTPWDWGRFAAAVIVAILGGISLAIGVEMIPESERK